MTHNFEHTESQIERTDTKLNWLRAAVLGANDGIVSTASIIVGVAAASNSASFILTAGVAGLFAGAFSMGVGEYVSVSSQRDAERALLEKERQELIDMPEEELAELALIYQRKGISKETAQKVAEELTAHDAFAAHVDAELHIDPNDLTNPWHAAWASIFAFFAGGIVPVIIVILSPATIRIPVTFVSMLFTLVAIGGLSAHVGGAKKSKAIIRVVFGGILAMVVTFAVGKLFGVVGL